jgi:antitoxin (DNA-binding transcriptional repressor) of toxin-antitoxin stability system
MTEEPREMSISQARDNWRAVIASAKRGETVAIVDGNRGKRVAVVVGVPDGRKEGGSAVA